MKGQKILDINHKRINTEKYWGIEESGLIYIQFSVKNNSVLYAELSAISFYIHLQFQVDDVNISLNNKKVSKKYLQA